MDKIVERIFRFIEMIGITALIKAVIAPMYPVIGSVVVGVLTAGATLYLIDPLHEYCNKTLMKDAKTTHAVVVAGLVTGALFLIIQIVWLNPLVSTTSDLIKSTISAPSPKNVIPK